MLFGVSAVFFLSKKWNGIWNEHKNGVDHSMQRGGRQ